MSTRVGDEPALVSCVGVARSYAAGSTAFTAVRDVTCEVRASNRIAVTGPSGSGKSTLLHLMAGLDTATAGTVSWPAFGGPPRASARLVGVVFQGPSLIPALDAIENVALPMILDGTAADAATERAHAALARLDLGAFARKLPDELSAGQAQRIAVARVLAGEPRLILADEPTGQLDHANASAVMDVLVQAADELTAALVVSTHDPSVANRLRTRWVMHGGSLDFDSRADAEAGQR
ncbi:ABC transporter ATP-binding protein [Mycolicibacterium arenosum]|uniref:ATP-binding cassette domain-containing protein n=1 Tax=Mycolicibacterium arenosum TaxID=2952157 RepID=A0ABT1MDI8_9MYCO|nr:ATP-binding cassette domain-containing protein [Mycolicibacterium sp. CAU 1645]MCP9276467.1 ATP-binding cassette domain-containing protein [Mycolicibacterium sp. CAU 1645]